MYNQIHFLGSRTAVSNPRKLPRHHFVSLDEILASLRVQLPELRQRYGIRSLGVFGSYARGEQKRGSDLDLLVEFDDRPLSLLGVVEIENRLSSVLGVTDAIGGHQSGRKVLARL